MTQQMNKVTNEGVRFPICSGRVCFGGKGLPLDQRKLVPSNLKEIGLCEIVSFDDLNRHVKHSQAKCKIIQQLHPTPYNPVLLDFLRY